MGLPRTIGGRRKRSEEKVVDTTMRVKRLPSLLHVQEASEQPEFHRAKHNPGVWSAKVDRRARAA